MTLVAYKQFKWDATMKAWFVAHYEKEDGVTWFVGLQHPTEKDWEDREKALGIALRNPLTV